MSFAEQLVSLKGFDPSSPEEALHALMTPPPKGYADKETYSQVAYEETVKWAYMIFIAARKIEEFTEVSKSYFCTNWKCGGPSKS